MQDHADARALSRAVAISSMAHADQLDKSGKPYITHPIRVMQQCEAYGIDAQIVAVLHDVVEDTWVTLDHIRGFGFPESIIDAVDAISKREQEPYFEYIARCARNPLAARVKLADLEDNMSPARAFKGSESLTRTYTRAKAIVSEALSRLTRDPTEPHA